MSEQDDIMAAYTVLFDGLHSLGPGDVATTSSVLARVRPHLPPRARVADFGCGVGASALVLAKQLGDARILALDLHAPFVERLRASALEQGLGAHLDALVGDMRDPPALDGTHGEFDLIWSESAIYHLGRMLAFELWRPLLRAGGWLVFSDIVWQDGAGACSSAAKAYWANAYPDLTTTATITGELAAARFHGVQSIVAPRSVWSNYYEPLRKRLRVLAEQPALPASLHTLLGEMEQEIAAYDAHGEEVELCFFVAQCNG